MNIVILDAGYKSYDFEQELFDRGNYKLSIYTDLAGDRESKVQFAKYAHGILVRHTIIDEEFLSGAKNLKAIVRYGVGYDNIDLPACTRAGILVANVQGYASHSVSDHALAFLLACSRGMWDVKKQVTTNFAAPPAEDIFELHDKTIGIIGLGRIGSEFSRKVQPLFRKIVACDPYKSEDYFQSHNVKRLPLYELLKESEVISIHCNLTPETRHLLNEQAFLQMIKKPVVLNTARGEIIDETALLQALLDGRIHSAGLDVYEDEPVTNSQEALINHPRTICTGHYAWYSDRASVELQKRAAINLYKLLKGDMVEDCVNL